MTIQELFDRSSALSGKTAVERVMNWNEEQSVAALELFARTCLLTLTTHITRYHIHAVECFPTWPEEIEQAQPFWLGGWEVWEKSFPQDAVLLMNDEAVVP